MALVESFSTLANAEEVQGLSKVIHSLADVEAKVAKLQLQQVTEIRRQRDRERE